jgi:hypothetical protein
MSKARHSAIGTEMSDFYHYSKGWYVCGDLFEDMKRIVGHRARIEPKHVTIGDIVTLR